MADTIGAVILAAGEGKRLKISDPKPLAPLFDKKLIDFPIKAIFEFFAQVSVKGKIGIVTGHQRERLESYLSENNLSGTSFSFAFQEKQQGTADALKTYFEKCSWAKDQAYTLVMAADTPAIQGDDLLELWSLIQENKLDGIAATFETDNPTGYGRIEHKNKGFVIVEEKDATEEQRRIKEVNSGLYIFKTSFILSKIDGIKNENKGTEFYLTDLFQENYNVETKCFKDSDTFLGVNNLYQLAEAAKILRIRHMKKLRDEGVFFVDLAHTYLDPSVSVEEGARIYPNVIAEGNCKIGSGSVIEAGCVLKESEVGENVELKAYSYLESCSVKNGAVIGPFARLRPGADIGPQSKIGNFVEIKQAKLDKGVKVSHLSYVGDAEIGENSNIGCGFITCNYDGAEKHLTKIGKNTFIGSDSQMVAPVSIGDNCYVASGSTINKSLENGDFAIARARQDTKKGQAKRFLKKKK